ncbi:hypothetical protein Landi51_07459 [Colletotrichum acutatum]
MGRIVYLIPAWVSFLESPAAAPSAAGELASVYGSRRGAAAALQDTDVGVIALLFSERRKWAQWHIIGYAPSGDGHLLLPNRVFAFALRNRKWACLPIVHDIYGNDLLQPITNPPEPRNDLELSTGHKELVQSLIKSHFSQDKSRKMHLDLVRDKGRGVIILLHGVPGVGKTSTAAECSGFRLTAYHVEVFFRVLKYYEGILFLTTNRVGTFDEAFKSRIHMSLYYPPLTETQTARIWSSRIRKVKANAIRIDEQDILAFAQQIWTFQGRPERGPVWNGRQIRNVFQSAIALAGYHTKTGEQIHLTRENFRRVGEVSDQFSRYIYKTKLSHTDADLNRTGGIRRDEFERDPSTQPAVPWRESQVIDPFLPFDPAPQPQRPNAQFGGSAQAATFQSVAQDPFRRPTYSASPWQTTTQPQQQQQQQQPQQQHPQQSQQAFLRAQAEPAHVQAATPQMFSPQQMGQPQAHRQSQPTHSQPGLTAGPIPASYEQQMPHPQQPEFGTAHQPVPHTQMAGNPNSQGPIGSSPCQMS